MQELNVVPLILTLSLLGCSAFEAPTRSAERSFVSTGHGILAQAGLSIRTGNPETTTKAVLDTTECVHRCNGEVMTLPECIGRAEVDCITVSEKGVNPKTVDVYTRTCDGKYLNLTTESGNVFQSSQACEGFSVLRMKTERFEPSNSAWVTNYTYKSTCFNRYIMTYITVIGPEGNPENSQVGTLCEGSAGMYVNEGITSQTTITTYEVYETDSNVTCNGEPSDWTKNCDGFFSATYNGTNEDSTIYCKGRWRFYMVNWICTGKYDYTRVERTEAQTSVLLRRCDGWATISTAALDTGYQLCNGDSEFDEKYTQPVHTT